jgi:DNA-binding NarL/FixJ family response regulator
LLWDIRLPGGSGALGMSELKARFPHLPVVVIHDSIYHESSQGLLGQRLTGVITRQVDEELLRSIICRLLEGGSWFSEQWLSPGTLLTKDSVDQLFRLVKLNSLSKSQLRVMKRVLRGRMNKQIAYELSVSEATVKVHISNMLRKFGVRSRSELIVSLLSPEIHKSSRVH